MVILLIFDPVRVYSKAENYEEELMAYKITDDCTNCGACEAECPVEAISEKDDMRWIDPDLCTSCGACAEVCPVEAILAD